MIQSISMGGGGSDRPHETVNFVYDKISWEYTPVNNDGTAGTKVGPKVWNLETNEAEQRIGYLTMEVLIKEHEHKLFSFIEQIGADLIGTSITSRLIR